MGNYKHFTDEELAGLDRELCAMLDMARDKSGVPFLITCGVRTPEQNASQKDSVSDSAHLTGHAVDLACSDDHTLDCMEYGLRQAGFRRIGIYITPDSDNPKKFVPHHIHVDNDNTKPQQVTWIVLEQ